MPISTRIIPEHPKASAGARQVCLAVPTLRKADRREQEERNGPVTDPGSWMDNINDTLWVTTVVWSSVEPTMGNLQCGPVVWSSGEPAVWTCRVEQCGPVVWSSGEPAVWTCSVEQCGAYNGEPAVLTCSVEQCGAYNGEPAVWTCSVEQCGAYNGEPAVWNLQRGAYSVDLQGRAASVE